ncbi:MAG: hypothetical protein IH586_23490, partial [Anaerolineaceae bacterium]|nr:hypothetical protein [Anaerolineaceae bacterium]
MSHPRWKKVLADLWGNKSRTLLVALSIAIGVFAVGFVASTYLILKNDVPADFNSANPHAAVIYSEPFDDDLLNSMHQVPGMGEVEGRSVVSLKLIGQDGNNYPIQIRRIAG